MSILRFVLLPLLLLAVAVPAFRASPLDVPDDADKARKAMAAFRTPPGLKVELFAAAPMVASPVALCLDERGRVFVAEEYRFNQGTEENRTRPFLLEDDLQLHTVDDRLKMFRKWSHKFPGGMEWFSRHADQVRMLEDRDGDGKADRWTVFAGGFNAPLDGLAAGVIARDGDVYLTCIPHLWLLKDTKGDGFADVRKPLLRGFGVNAAFLGHDLHGLAWGPDGKLYFSVGDRGFHVETKEGATLSGPRTGAVFRCNPDGTELEVVCRGLRNPQELAFDQFGNLFADDNNCDRGDHARLVYVVEDGDCGWNMAYQTIPDPYTAGPWFAERMWHLPHKGQPAWIVPPVGKLGAGPSGFCFSSGTSLPDRYRNRFFMCNYTGNGGVESFGVKPHGAGFEMVDYHDFLKPVMATDVDFGYDGKMYVADFVNLLWTGGSGGGRVFTVFDPEKLKDPVVRETKRLFAEGFRQRPDAELRKLLRHPDWRVRQRAQFTLAERGPKSVPDFAEVAAKSDDQLARLHAVWGLGQIGRKHPEALRPLVPLLDHPEPEVRAQAAKVLGECRRPGADAKLIARLQDAEPRVRFFAAQALGKFGHKSAVEALFAMLRANADADPFLRHAGVAALARIGDAEAVQARAKDPTPAVRMAVALVQRRLKDPRVAQFLADADLDIATEAARAIHDVPIDEAAPALAKALERFGSTPGQDVDPLIRRAIHTHYRLGKAENARAVLGVVLNPHFSLAVRAEALASLGDWADPPPRDRVTGFWRPLPKRDPAAVRAVLEESVTPLLTKTSGRLQSDAVAVLSRLNVRVDEAAFARWVADADRDVNTRVASLRLLAARKYPKLGDVLNGAMEDDSPQLRAEARDLLAAIEPKRAAGLFRDVLEESAALEEKQRALAGLARLKTPEAGEVLDAWAERLGGGKVPAELRLDVLEALKAFPGLKRSAGLQKFEGSVPVRGPLRAYQSSLLGGNAERGREVFFGHAAAQCVRCHTVNGTGGTAGPDLSKLVARYPDRTREFLLESLILPDAKISPGFGSVTLRLADGRVISGLLQAEDGKSVTVTTPEGRKETIAKEDIDERTATKSPMPSMERTLSPREVRDLLEYLMTLK